MKDQRILTLNSGSSSLKFSIYEVRAGAETLRLHGKLDRIGAGQGHFEAVDAEGRKLADEAATLGDHAGAIKLLLERLPSFGAGEFSAVGHRIVQGGPHHLGPEVATPALLAELEALCPLDPPHLPAALKALEAVQTLGNDLPQVVCFDTSFHRSMPPVAQQLPLPCGLTEDGKLMRYGFHGLSYEFIVSELRRIGEIPGKLVIAHLGNGASMAAVLEGRCVETTMGFTPAGGLVMSSRAGDLDPGVIAYLLREGKLTPEALSDFLYQQCGMKGVSGLGTDLRDLMEAAPGNPKAAMAVDLFCYSARKALGSLVAVLDGVDAVVFTGGIGENAAVPRGAICEGLQHLGLKIDTRANEESREIISAPGSRVTVRVIKTNEELVIARHTARLAFST